MEEMKQSIAWGMIGTGAVARRFAEGLSHVPDATLAAVWGRNTATTETLAVQSGAIACESVESLLSSSIDAVYIGTHPDSHAEYSIAALKAGKHVLCEKPVMMNSGELDRVLDIARQHDLLFMEAMKPPFFPVYQRLLRQLEEEPIGPVGFVRAGHSTADVPPEHPSWRLELGGGGLMSIGVYQAFFAVYWMGEAHEVQALGRINSGVDAFACVQTTHAAGFAQLYSGMDLSGPGDAVLAGVEGYATIHKSWWNPVSATVRYRDGRVVELNEPIVGGGFNYETEHFCELIRNGQRESPVMTHERSRQMMRILDRARTAVGVSL
jgi:scyllo-inositol 2-dehydrogenase (NADP+)